MIQKRKPLAQQALQPKIYPQNPLEMKWLNRIPAGKSLTIVYYQTVIPESRSTSNNIGSQQVVFRITQAHTQTYTIQCNIIKIESIRVDEKERSWIWRRAGRCIMSKERNINGKILKVKNSKILKKYIDKDYWIYHMEMSKNIKR